MIKTKENQSGWIKTEKITIKQLPNEKIHLQHCLIISKKDKWLLYYFCCLNKKRQPKTTGKKKYGISLCMALSNPPKILPSENKNEF